MLNQFYNIVLNRKPMLHDHRDIPLYSLITPEMRLAASLITSNEWKVARILDQGSTGHCVGFAWAGFGISLPVFDNWQNAMGDKIYYAAKIIDGEPGQEDGSNTRSGVQAFTQFSNLDKYAFATSFNDIVTWVLTQGPVIVGTNWYDAMFQPDSSGLVKIGGSIAGGHEFEISGADTARQLLKCTNSWGTSFAQGGQFYISFSDMQRLQNEQGDACTAVETSGTPVPPTPIPTPVPTPTPNPFPGCFNLIAATQAAIDKLTAAKDPTLALYIKSLQAQLKVLQGK